MPMNTVYSDQARLTVVHTIITKNIFLSTLSYILFGIICYYVNTSGKSGEVIDHSILVIN